MQTDTISNFLDSTDDEGIFKEINSYLENTGHETESEKKPETEADIGAGTEPGKNATEEQAEKTPVESAASDIVYSAQQIGAEIGVVKQTIHNYTDQYPEFIHPFNDPKGQRYYSAGDAEVIRTISNLKKQKMDTESIKKYLYDKYSDRISPSSGLPDLPGMAEPKTGMTELADSISSQVEGQIRSFFEIGMKGIYTRLDAVSDSLKGVDDALRGQAETADRNEGLVRNIEAAVSHNADAINEMNRNVTSKVDRSISRSEASLKSMQESLERTSTFISKDVKDKLNENADGITVIQKEIEKIRSANTNRKVDDLGKSLQDTLAKERQDRINQSKELQGFIKEALTPPEYHPEDSREYRNLKEKYDDIMATFEKTKTALMNMQGKIDEQEAAIEKQGKQLSVQTMQISALNGQIQRYKNRIQYYEEENESLRNLLEAAENEKKDTETEENPAGLPVDTEGDRSPSADGDIDISDNNDIIVSSIKVESTDETEFYDDPDPDDTDPSGPVGTSEMDSSTDCKEETTEWSDAFWKNPEDMPALVQEVNKVSSPAPPVRLNQKKKGFFQRLFS